MAITLSTATASSVIRLRFYWLDVRGQTDTETLLIGAASTDIQIEGIIQAMDNLSNAQLKAVDVETVSIRHGIGMKAAPVNAVYDLLSMEMVLAFEGPNPINAARTVRRPVAIPSYIRSKDEVGLTGKPNTADTDMAALIVILNSQMAIFGDDGNAYVGGLHAVDADGNAVSIGDIVT